MPVLKDIIKGVNVVEIKGNTDIEILSLSLDSRKICPGSLFLAVPGTQADGHEYIGDAVAKGAAAVICGRIPETVSADVTYIAVDDPAEASGIVSSSFYGNPSRKLKLVGVTGTNGKTTVATLLSELFTAFGHRTGLLSTVENRIGNVRTESTHTTPDAVSLNALLAEMADTGCEYCFMEVSSHSIVQRRIAGLEFAGGIFTNLTHDHLDYHGTFASYLAAKKRFFDDLPAGSFALVNIDDRNGKVMVQNTKAVVKAYSLRSPADFRCRVMEMLFDGMLLDMDGHEVWVNFIGRFNAGNLLAVYACATLLGVDKNEILVALSALKPVAGRFEYVRSSKGVTAIIDYAHTPDALRNVLKTINEIRLPGQKLYTVVGCGGDRDREKRPVMARISASESDLTILTSDNPRSEDPTAIIEDMKPGILKGMRYLAICDRREAIRTAVMSAEEGDIVLIAGKGHETYQEAAGTRVHFDDKEEAMRAFDEFD